METLANRRVVVVGLGRSGRAAARLAVREGALVTGTDLGTVEALGDLSELERIGVRLELGGHRLESFLSADLVVKSPGIRPDVPELNAARERGIPIIGEVELCAPWLSAPVVAITGTNGKSTTTALTAHLLRMAGLRVFAGANLGTPVAEHVLSGEQVDAAVLELSSYQIDDADRLRVDVAVVLNVTPDHLERYGTVEKYAASKERLLGLRREGGLALLGSDSPFTSAMARRAVGEVISFGASGQARIDGDTLRVAGVAGEERYLVRARTLRGAHNRENALAAVMAARRLGASPESIQRGLDTFGGLPHRLESLRTIDGVEWVNDSKATNVDSVEKSLAAFAGPLHLIMGGKGKGASYASLRPLVSGRVARLYLIGADAPALLRELGDLVETVECEDLPTAVREAHAAARPGETVLLSPACASFDQFRSFEHRGEVFRRLVEALGQTSPASASGGAA